MEEASGVAEIETKIEAAEAGKKALYLGEAVEFG